MKAVFIIDAEEGRLAEFFNALAEVTSILEPIGKIHFYTTETVELKTTQMSSQDPTSPSATPEIPDDYAKLQAAKVASQRRQRPPEAEVSFGDLAALQGKARGQQKGGTK